jgi:c-di-GMP-binding flagellar brake protein YcgR
MLFLDKLFKKSFRTPATGAGLSVAGNNENGLSPNNSIPEQYLPLWELQKQRQLLEVKIGDANRAYQSMILAIDVERGLLWLDDLFPQQRVLDAGDEIILRHHRNTEQLVIRSPIVAMGSTYGASGFAVLLPDFVCYMPRRNTPRFAIGHQSLMSAKIRPLGQESSFGTVQDISTGGLRLLVAGNLLPHLRHGALLSLCEVDVSDNLQIRCRARVCAFRMGRSPYRHTQISIEFVDLDEGTRAALGRFLREAELDHAHSQRNNTHPAITYAAA